MDLPILTNYGEYLCDNYGDHTMAISIPTKKGYAKFWYSYETVIAFESPLHRRIDLKNSWGPTTGKHMNWLSDKSNRLDEEEFHETMEKQLKEIQYDESFFIEDN